MILFKGFLRVDIVFNSVIYIDGVLRCYCYHVMHCLNICNSINLIVASPTLVLLILLLGVTMWMGWIRSLLYWEG